MKCPTCGYERNGDTCFGCGYGRQYYHTTPEGIMMLEADQEKRNSQILQKKLDRAEALLARVFGKHCVCKPGYLEACLVRDVERGECMFTWEHADGTIDCSVPYFGRRKDCPYTAYLEAE